MPGFLKQATAAQSRLIGPFLDSTDFVTAETGLTIANTDVKLSANGAASADKNSGGGTHRVNGHYGFTFDATDSATVGQLAVSIVVAGALPVWDTFTVLEEAVYDALFAASAPGYVANAPVNVAQFGGSNLTAAAGIPEVKVASIANNAITAASINADAITDAKVAGDVTIASVTGAVGSVTGNVGGNVTGSVGSVAAGGIAASSFAAGAIDAAAIAANAIGASELAADAVAEIADAVWDEAIAGHLSAGSTGEALDNAGAAGTPPTTAEIADKILGRNLAGGSDGGRMVKDALRSLRNKTSITAGTLTVTQEDDTTTAWTAAVTTTPGDPLSAIDPA